MGTVDQTMPALFAPASGVEETYVPLAQLGVGSDGVAVLARKGERLVELLQLSFGPSSARWPLLEHRLRAVGAVDHPAMRAVLAFEAAPPTVILEGDSSPPLAELIEQASVDLTRAMNIVGELARAVAAAHHVGIVHGRIDPWSVHVGAGDHPRLELTGLQMRPATHPWTTKCVAPEAVDGFADAAADVYSIGALLELFASAGKRDVPEGVRTIISDATAQDPEARPTAHELVRKLIGAGTVVARSTLMSREMAAVGPQRPTMGLALGRFELTKQLGAGAMGEVWEARDTTGGPSVAIKLLKPEIAADAELLRRFRKEARVLAKVGSPFIANYIDLNEDHGLHYLVLELVTGGSVAGAMRRLGKLPERLSLGVIADTCRALAEPHRLGIVHRDIKPDNLMFVREGIELEANPLGQLVKLGDFGIARLVEHTGPEGSTREGTVLGTPEYMAPEQCQGASVTPATDVYALGCCLFALIAGRPPFVAREDNQMAVILAHLGEVPPRLDSIEPEVSPAVADLVMHCLDKDSNRRPQDAAEMLATIERLCDGVAALITAHPAPPIVRAGAVQTYSFHWDLQCSPDVLWPFVSNTEKMNRATGQAPVRFEIESMGAKSATGSATTGHQRVAGMNLKWREHPYEWIEGSRHVVLRVFEKGVLRWYVAEVQLERLAGGGTRLRNTIKIEPRGLTARLLSKWEIGVKYRRKLERVYTRLDRLLAAGPKPEIDPIDPEIVVSPTAQARVDEAATVLTAAGIDAGAIESLATYLLRASDQDLARIRPIELAAKFRIAEDAMIDACLHAAKIGLLAMVWDVICPSCRIPSTVVDSLQKIEEHGSCKACNVGFQIDFSRAIELAFRASPDVREVETRTFCVGGPAHFPHVAAQVRLQPGERFALPLTLQAGYYLLRSPQLPRSHELRVTASGGVRRVDITLGERLELPALTQGDQLLTLVNPAPREVVVRVERAGDRANALTAARVMACAAFRELFPDQALAPGRLMAVTQATLVVAHLDDAQNLFRELGDSKAFPVAAQFFEIAGTLAKEYGGSLVKTFGGLAIAAFERPGPAMDVALALQQAIDRHPVTNGLRCRVAVHRGPMMVLTQSGRLDYFGQNVELALAISAATPPGVVGLTATVCQDVSVAERLQKTPDHLGMSPLAGGSWVLHVRASRASARALPAAGQTAQTIVQ
ncbi:MAG: serine/threonine protein kinase [Myxococcales bacterium]|nr:serine/threonine protein kinase [Myxococcales bacterium]